MAKYRIAILGIGGVGGYLGGMLAAAGNKETEIIFIARTQSKEIIKEKGLKLITNDTEKVVRPDLVSDDPAEIGQVDLLVCSVKGYDLESLLPYKACFKRDTAILPLLNGIGIDEKIKKLLPDVKVWEGCIYVIARQVEKGVIKQAGAVELIFGSPTAVGSDLQKAGRLFEQAGVKTTIPENIEAEIWKKFLFISVMATATSYYNSGLGPIRDNPESYINTKKLLEELSRVAAASGAQIPSAVIDGVGKRIDTLPGDATSSMNADFQKGGKTELEELTGDVIRLGATFSIATPVYEMMYEGLKKRGQSR